MGSIPIIAFPYLGNNVVTKMEKKIDEYEKEVQEQDQNVEKEYLGDFDVSNPEDLEKLQDMIQKQSAFFNPEPDKTYKVIFLSTHIKPIKKVFKDGPQIKYELEVEVKEKDKVIFTGIWDVGTSIVNKIKFKELKIGDIYLLTREGVGINTRYNFIKRQ